MYPTHVAPRMNHLHAQAACLCYNGGLKDFKATVFDCLRMTGVGVLYGSERVIYYGRTDYCYMDMVGANVMRRSV